MSQIYIMRPIPQSTKACDVAEGTPSSGRQTVVANDIGQSEFSFRGRWIAIYPPAVAAIVVTVASPLHDHARNRGHVDLSTKPCMNVHNTCSGSRLRTRLQNAKQWIVRIRVVDTEVFTSETTLKQFIVYMRKYPVPLQCPYSALTVPLQFPYGNYHSALIFYVIKKGLPTPPSFKQ